jgi:CRP/FNR family transcriptional regulator
MPPRSSPAAVKTAALEIACSKCNLRELCLPVGFSDRELERIEGLVATRRTVRRGEALFRDGAPFEAVYAVRTGFFKTRVSPRTAASR